MKHLFIPYELAVIAKEKGFWEPCFGTYATSNEAEIKEGSICYYEGLFAPHKDGGSVLTPLYQQIVDWFYEKHEIDISAKRVGRVKKQDYFVSYIDFGWASDEFKTRKEALNKAIEEAFKLI